MLVLAFLILAAVLFLLAAIFAWPRRAPSAVAAYCFALAYFGLFFLVLSMLAGAGVPK